MSTQQNQQLVLVVGKAASGKSSSLKNLNNPQGVMYLNCENGKQLPFTDTGFQQYKVTDPLQVIEAIDAANDMDDIHTVVIDSLTFLFSLYESLHLHNAPDGRKAWGDFAHYFKQMMHISVARSTKNIIFTAHTLDYYKEVEGIVETRVPVKGSNKEFGIEAFFTIVVATKKVPVRILKKYPNPLLNITKRDAHLEFKHVIQTQVTKETLNESIRTPQGMFSLNETYIDGDIQHVIDRINGVHEALPDEDDIPF